MKPLVHLLMWSPLFIAVTYAAEVQDVRGYVVRDSGYIGTFDGATHAPLGWVDDDRLLFVGAKPGDAPDDPEARGPGGSRAPRFALYLWDLKTTKVTLRFAGHPTSLLCVADGWI